MARKQKHRSFRSSGLRGEHDYLVAAAGLFLLVATMHALRILYDTDVRIGEWSVPPWVSIVAVVVAGYMGWRGYKLSSKAK
ncbi:MAG: hypothetical protein WD850_03490 [Candidatus Spechtbacterales bacterium]